MQVGITLARMLTLDGTWRSFAESFSRNAPYLGFTGKDAIFFFLLKKQNSFNGSSLMFLVVT